MGLLHGIGSALTTCGRLLRSKAAPPAGPIFTGWPWQRRLGTLRPASYSELLSSYQSWVYACVRLISSRVSTIPARVFVEVEHDRSLRREELRDHPLVSLLRQPNPHMTAAFLFSITQTHLDLTGNAYWLKVRDRLGIVRELYPLQPDRVRVMPDPDRFIQGYLYMPRGSEIPFGPEEIIHFKVPHPSNPWYGLGPVEALAYEVDLDLYMRIYQKLVFENDATPSGILSTDKSISEPDAERLRARWYERYGGLENRAKVAILHSGLKFEAVTISPKDLEFMSQARINRDKLLAAFGVPASKLGLVEDVNRANAEANDLTFNQECIAPRLALRDGFLTIQLAREFDPRLVVQSDDPVPTNREQNRADRQAYVQAGILTINEVREQLGKPPVPWGREAWMPIGLVPVAMGGAGAGYGEMEVLPSTPLPEESPGQEPSEQAGDIAAVLRYRTSYGEQRRRYFSRQGRGRRGRNGPVPS